MSMFRLLAVGALLCASVLCRAGSFETYHPDQYFRNRGVDEHDRGRIAASLKSFTSAARYGDKPSQLVLAMMYWTGDGTAVDRPRGYAWADLSAERGYQSFVAVREQLWEQMNEDERAQAKTLGKEIYAEYGDAVAKPRLNSLLKRGFVQKTGSHSGASASGLGVAPIDPAARASMTSAMYTSMANNVNAPGSATEPEGVRLARLLRVGMGALAGRMSTDYYSDSNWKPEYYWREQDFLWRDVPVGTVIVGKPTKAEGGGEQ